MSKDETARGSGPVWLVVAGLAGAAFWWWRSGAESAAVPAAEQGEQQVQAIATSLPEARPELVLNPRFAERATVAGIVRDPQGQPVAGAQVCATTSANELASKDMERPSCTKTERDGHYRIEGLFPVRYAILASAAGFAPGKYYQGEGAARRSWIDLRPKMEALGVDITLEDGGVEIHGFVKDLSGGPIEGAQVTAGATFAWTAADGSFSAWVAEGSVWIVANADGYARGHEEGLAPGHEFELFLTPEAVLVGKVVRAGEGGGPIEGAQVIAVSGGWGFMPKSAYTDANGEFRIEGLEPGAYKARAEADDALGVAKEQVILGLGETSDPILIEAHPAFTVEGKIVTEGGGSCDNGNVSLADPAQGREAWMPIESDGTVRKRGVLPGDYQVHVRCRGFVSAERYERVKVVDKSVTGLRWDVSKGQSIRGVVVDASGKPVPKMNLEASLKPDPSRARAHQTANVWGPETDAQGRFELAGLLPGTYDVSVNSWGQPRATPATPTVVEVPKGKDATGVRIELPATGEVRGSVRDSKGQPIAAAKIGANDGVHWQFATAADDGSFHFKNLASGDYRITARMGWFGETMRAPGTSDDDVQGERVEVREGKVATVKLVVESASGRITGVVRDEDGGPVADAFVEATRESESAASSAGAGMRQGRWGEFFEKPNLTDQDGKFTLERLETGKHTLRAHRKGGGEAIVEHVALGSEVVLTIASPGRMSGTVNVRGGAAPEEFTIVVLDEATGYQRHDNFFRTGGAWSVPDLPAGNYKVSVTAGGGTAEVHATMAAGKDTSGVRIELAPKVTVRGTVVDTDGKPIAGLEVSVSAPGTWSSSRGDEDKRHVTDEQGRYEVTNAPSGKVQVNVYPRSWGNSEYSYTSMPVMLSADASETELAPIKVARKRVKDGEKSGELGIKLKEPEPGADPLTRQLIVAYVRPGSAAALAGLQIGDVIVSVDGQDVTGANAYLYHGLTEVLEGTALTLGLANGKSLSVTAGKAP
ncbi:PDZ domain (Also known as DHR or GLGF) [Nannocystis exedens]|uniref:PDZ domain (Also known as DHR or GLGF) n=1 Tax=Nannocystis exedens TaxID=54 RepID=A0A1I1X659_9BACT|nr:carboxypeptidase regulatory-like domain-containing protein [Nannocystis exedens]PCC70886.1 PDZ domain protein [Nannocystis exedens]SFE00800.1 PDZ domain (Also known as DHR or GLGF) [Nannocystis exedens]